MPLCAENPILLAKNLLIYYFFFLVTQYWTHTIKSIAHGISFELHTGLDGDYSLTLAMWTLNVVTECVHSPPSAVWCKQFRTMSSFSRVDTRHITNVTNFRSENCETTITLDSIRLFVSIFHSYVLNFRPIIFQKCWRLLKRSSSFFARR